MNTGLTLVSNNQLINGNLEDIVLEALLNGVDTVVLREKTMETRKLYNLAFKIKNITNKLNKKLIINDRIDIALAVKADGVHLGQNSFLPYIARQILGSKCIIGVSAHNLIEAQKAQNEGANYIFLGHIFESQSKPGLVPKGINTLLEVSENIDIPVTAIGGINKNNIFQLTDIGVKNIAVMSEILKSPNVAKTVSELKSHLY